MNKIRLITNCRQFGLFCLTAICAAQLAFAQSDGNYLGYRGAALGAGSGFANQNLGVGNFQTNHSWVRPGDSGIMNRLSPVGGLGSPSQTQFGAGSGFRPGVELGPNVGLSRFPFRDLGQFDRRFDLPQSPLPVLPLVHDPNQASQFEARNVLRQQADWQQQRQLDQERQRRVVLAGIEQLREQERAQIEIARQQSELFESLAGSLHRAGVAYQPPRGHADRAREIPFSANGNPAERIRLNQQAIESLAQQANGSLPSVSSDILLQSQRLAIEHDLILQRLNQLNRELDYQIRTRPPNRWPR